MQVYGELFGISNLSETVKIAILPVPWDVATSYGKGTSLGPQAILEASQQIDLEDLEFGDLSTVGINFEKKGLDWRHQNDQVRSLSQSLIQDYDQHGRIDDLEKLHQVNQENLKLHNHVYEWAQKTLENKQLPIVLGGDHSSPYGLIKALSEKFDFGVLHIDAHMDLRESYQGFTHSHASIMYNIMKLPSPPQSLVQVGIRDFCKEEKEFGQQNNIHTYFDETLNSEIYKGKNWNSLCEDIISSLPSQVYISFDIDGLDPKLCPNTGTPVPGGLSFNQALHLIKAVTLSGRKICGLDLCEVSLGENPNPSQDWDANVGARVLYKLCGWAAKSQQWI